MNPPLGGGKGGGKRRGGFSARKEGEKTLETFNLRGVRQKL